MKPIILVIYVLSSGLYSEPHATREMCNDALVEAELVLGNDLWSGGCFEEQEKQIKLTKFERIEP